MPTKPGNNVSVPEPSEMDLIVNSLVRIGQETADSLLANRESQELHEIEEAMHNLDAIHCFLSLARVRNFYLGDVIEVLMYLHYVASTLCEQHPELRPRIIEFESLDFEGTARYQVLPF